MDPNISEKRPTLNRYCSPDLNEKIKWKKTIPGKVIKILQMTLQVKWVNINRDNKHIFIAKTLKNIILNEYTYLKKNII